MSIALVDESYTEVCGCPEIAISSAMAPIEVAPPAFSAPDDLAGSALKCDSRDRGNSETTRREPLSGDCEFADPELLLTKNLGSIE